MSEKEIISWLQKVLSGDAPLLPATADKFITDIIRLAEWHGVTALVHYKLSGANKLQNYPVELVNQLTAGKNRMIAGVMLWEHEVLEVQKLLNAEKTRSLLIKGYPLSRLLYPEPYLRPFSDLDILFADQNSAEKALLILANRGYTKMTSIAGKYISYQFSCYRTGSSGFNWLLDLHWRINNYYYFANALPFDELDTFAVRLSVENTEMRTLSPEYALLYASLHRLAHLPFAEANRLIWLYDIHLLAESLNEKQWASFAQLVTGKKLSAVCLDGLLNSKSRFNTFLPDNILKMLQAEGINDRVQPQNLSSVTRYFISNLQMMPGWTERLGYLLEHLLPSPEYMLQKYHREKKYWLPLLYIMRIAEGLISFLKR